MRISIPTTVINNRNVKKDLLEEVLSQERQKTRKTFKKNRICFGENEIM